MFKVLIALLALSAMLHVPQTNSHAACLPQPSGLVSWWKGESWAVDQAGANHGSLSTWTSYNYTAGKAGQAFNFDNLTQLQAPAANFPTNNAARSMALWVNISQHQTSGNSFFAGYGAYGSARNMYALGALGSSDRRLYFTNWGDALIGPPLDENRWYHVAVTNTGNSTTLYLDGLPVGTQSLELETTNDAFIAGYGSSVSMLNGVLDEIQVYNRALSASEVQAIYTADGSGLCYQLNLPPTTLPDGAKGVYFNQSIPVDQIGTGPYEFALSSGTLPPGLTLFSDGTITGIPTTDGTFPFAVSVKDSGSGSGSNSYSITITAPIISDPMLAAATWQSIGPYSSRVRSLVIDPNDTQTVYTGTRDGLFKTTNGGASWKMITEGMTNQYIRAIAVTPGDSQTIYAGTDGGLFKSIDGGASWEPSSAGFPEFTEIQSLAIDHANPLIIYAGTGYDGMFKSTNGGVSWTAINTGITYYGSYASIKTIAIDPVNSQKITIGAFNGGAFVSADGGAYWTESSLAVGGLRHITHAPGNSQLMFAASSESGVMISTDAGVTWAQAPNSLADQFIYYVAVHPANSQILFAGADNGNIYLSTDRGANWSAIRAGSTPVNRIIFDPSNPMTIYAGYDNNGVFKSVNGGATWAPASYGMTNTVVQSMAIDHSNSRTIYASTWTAISKSTNGGATWAVSYEASNNEIGRLAIDPVDSRTLYASRFSDVIIKSTDGGTTWYPLPASPVNAYPLVVAPNDSQTLYVAAATQLLKSTTGGALWTEIRNAGLNIFSIAVDPHNSQVVYVGSGGEIWKTGNGGTTWTITGGLADDIRSLTIDPLNSQTVYAAAYNRLLRSTDGGGTWNTVSQLPVIMNINQLAVDPSDSRIIYAGTNGNGVFVSTNSGESWNVFNNGLPADSDIWYLGIDPFNSKALYAGTETSGAFKTTTSTTPVISAPPVVYFNEDASGSFKISSSGWPNPTVSVSGTMPDGLTFDPLTGIISGTPGIGSASEVPYTLIFTADNGHPPAASRAVSVYVLDVSSLSVTITTPTDGANTSSPPTSIKGTRSNSAVVTVQITDGSMYLQANGSFTASPAWLATTATSNSWTLTINQNAAWVEGITYTVIAKAQTTSAKTATSTFRIIPATNKSVTVLSTSFTPDAIKTGDTALISGSLVKPDGTPLATKNIKVIITPPATEAVPTPAITVNSYTTDAAGLFSSPDLSGFTAPGIYTVQARFEGDADNQASTLSLSLPVIAQSGYAVIVVGKTTDNSLLDLHKATAATIKSILINKRGFLGGNIISVISSTSNPNTKSKTDIANALAAIKIKYAAAPAPVYLIMIDHGSSGESGGFMMGSQTVLPSDIGAMLDTFEAGISTETLAAHRRFLIVGTCYSGLFQSIARPDRVIITSSSATEQSLAGSVSYNGNAASLAGGDFFIDTLFSYLGRGDNFKDAFTQATTAVELRDPRSVPLALHSGVVDTYAQHPLLNDNGDMAGSYKLDGSGDGIASSSLYLGEGVKVPASGNPNDITAVSVTPSILETGMATATISLQVHDNSRVDRAWVEIRTPDTTVVSGGTGQVQPGNLDSIPLVFDGLKWVGDYAGFVKAGTYHVYYYTRDNQTLDISPMAHSVVYKKKAGNTPPAGFTLTSPLNSSQQNPPFQTTWAASVDSDKLTYTLLVATDQNFGSVIYRQEGIPTTAWMLQDSVFKDPANPGFYYCQNSNPPCWWKVQAVDSYGLTTESDIRSFNIVKTGDMPGFIQGYVVNAVDGTPLPDATVSAGGTTAPTWSKGEFVLIRPGGTYTVTATLAGYSVGSTVVTLPSGASVNVIFSLAPLPAVACGSSNGGSFDLAPAANLCNPGTPSAVTGSGPWNWTCTTSGAPVGCSAAINSYPLTVSYAGNGGSGSVNSDLPGIHCTDNACPAASFSYGTAVKLTGTPDNQSLFGGWSENCIIDVDGNCGVTMNGTKNVTVTFNIRPPIWLGGFLYPATLGDAFFAAANLATIKTKAVTISVASGDLTYREPGKTVTVTGGFNAGYTDNSDGSVTIEFTGGKLAVADGTLKVQQVAVKPKP